MSFFEEIRKIGSKLQLMYVEDDELVRNATLTILDEYFSSIIIAHDGEDGFTKFQENKIDIIITDINMPKCNGIKMTQKIKELNSNVPILILSAYNETGYFMDSIRYGVEGYLIKPIDLKQFEYTLHKTLKNIQMREENESYKISLEEKVSEQIDQLIEKDMLISRQSKLAAMGEMIDVIAHQWKQPLNIISMKTNFLSIHKKQDETIDYKYVHECEKDIKLQINHLSSTLDEFRNFFRPNYHIISLDLHRLFGSLKVLLKDELIHNTIDLRVDCPLDIYINTNENDIKHLFINLIKNSIDEMLKSKIQYDQRIIEIKTTQEDRLIKIELQDSGKGIPLDVLPNLFQANFTTKAESGGTGIGLYMCKQIVHKYNGEIEVSNSKDINRGALFSIYLPKGNSLDSSLFIS